VRRGVHRGTRGEGARRSVVDVKAAHGGPHVALAWTRRAQRRPPRCGGPRLVLRLDDQISSSRSSWRRARSAGLLAASSRRARESTASARAAVAHEIFPRSRRRARRRGRDEWHG
jgi:hypothetical protein